MNKPTSFEEACVMIGKTPEQVLPEAALAVLTPREVLSRKVDTITKAINRPDYKPNHADTNEPKYWPYHEIIEDEDAPFGFRLVYRGCVCGHVFASLGARLPFETSEGAVYMGKTFAQLYKDLLTAE